jgi:hypothetical protein
LSQRIWVSAILGLAPVPSYALHSPPSFDDMRLTERLPLRATGTDVMVLVLAILVAVARLLRRHMASAAPR